MPWQKPRTWANQRARRRRGAGPPAARRLPVRRKPVGLWLRAWALKAGAWADQPAWYAYSCLTVHFLAAPWPALCVS